MPTKEREEWTIEFYKDARGRFPVEEFLDQLQSTERAKVDNHFELLSEFGPWLREPHAKSLSEHKPLQYLRPGNLRLFYFLHKDHRCIMLHVFRKKRFRIPSKEIEKAKHRLDEFLESEGKA